MKKNLLISIGCLLITAVLFFSCQKSVTEKAHEEVSISKPDDGNDENQCQLVHLNLEGWDNLFHYNRKGLVDEWRIDYGDGVPDIYTMTYNNHDKLSHAQLHNNGELLATIDFTWTANLLTKENWNYSGYLFDIRNTYDKKGQRIKIQSSDGYSSVTQYSANGNTPKSDLFFDGELIQRGEYTYYKPNKNPLLAIPGLPYGFPYINFDFSPWWETSEKLTEYDNGVPTVIQDYDPAKTVFQFGSHHYPVSVSDFDKVTNSTAIYTFEYQNCGRDDNAPSDVTNSFSTQPSNPGKIIARPMLLKKGPADNIRKQLEQMRKQHSN